MKKTINQTGWKTKVRTFSLSMMKLVVSNSAIISSLLLALTLASVCVVPAYAAGAADALWNTISTLISTWVTRLGAVVMFVGGVMFGLSWKNDDAEGKSRGISTIISGAIVIAVAALTGTFFA